MNKYQYLLAKKESGELSILLQRFRVTPQVSAMDGHLRVPSRPSGKHELSTINYQKYAILRKTQKNIFFCLFTCVCRKKVVTLQPIFENRSPWGLKTNITMTRKRKQENLAYLLEIEQELLRKGKRLSKTFYGMKQSAEEALARA